RLRAQLRSAPGARRPALEREVVAAENRLELDRARAEFVGKLRQLGSSTPGADDDELVRRIQALQDAVPELGAAARPPGAAGRAARAPRRGRGGRARAPPRRPRALQHSRPTLEPRAGTPAGLPRRVDGDLRVVQDSLKPISARLRALASDPTAGGTSLLD